MATSIIKKGTLELDGNILSLFSEKGFVDGEYWIINAFFGSFIQVDPAPASGEVADVINADIVDGNLKKIDHILVNPNTGLRLYLENIIVFEDIRQAKATEEEVVFSSIAIQTSEGIKRFNVVVRDDGKYGCATVDADGNIV